MKFYLAGPVGYGKDGTLWKEDIKKDLRKKGHEVYDPIENDHKYPLVDVMNNLKKDPKNNLEKIKEVMQNIFYDDCHFITNCDYIICYFIGRSFGTISEQGIAHYLSIFLGKKIKTINIFDETFHPDEWVICCSDHVILGLENAQNFFEEEFK